MATQLTPQTGLPVTPTASAADVTGNYVVPGNTDFAIRVNNGSGVSVTVTLDDPTTTNPEGVSPAINPDVAIAIPAGAARYILMNKARRARFTNPTNGRVLFTASPVASVTVEVVAV